MLSIQGCNGELVNYIWESFSTAVLAHFQSTFNPFLSKTSQKSELWNKKPILLQKQFSSVKCFQLWLFLLCFYTSVFSHVGVPVITNNNWSCAKDCGWTYEHTFSSIWFTMSGICHYHTGKGSMMGKALLPWWTKACLNWLCYQAWVEITQDFSISSLKKLIISFVGSFFTAYWMSCITSWVVSSLSLLDFPFFTDLLGTNSSAWSSTCQQYCHKENFQGYMEVVMKILMAPKHVLVGMSPLFSPRQTRH